MNGDKYAELLDAILSLREAVELGFSNVRTEFRAELQTQLAAQDERWNRRFNALEARVESGFAAVDERFAAMDRRFDDVDKRFAAMDLRFLT